MRLLTLTTAAALALMPLTVEAGSDDDPITASLQAAMDAYADGDLQYALDELAYAQQLLNAMKAEGLAEYLPAPMEGWTMSLNDDAGPPWGSWAAAPLRRPNIPGPATALPSP